MAVGAIYSNTTTRPLAETWAGHGWRLASSPIPPGGGVLESVSCIRPHHCVAVGYALGGVPNGLGHGAFVEAWNGSSWSAQPTPSAAGQIELHSVSCTSLRNCVAVGLESPLLNSNIRQPLIERWNGANWTIDQQASPSVLSNACGTVCPDLSRALAGVACASASACEAVGSTETSQGRTTFAESWNGTSWATTPTANPAPAPPYDTLTAVSCTTPTVCVAVGSGESHAFAERWDGKRWSVHGSSRETAATPNSISCTSGSHCEIVGAGAPNHNSEARPQAWLWNGLSWAAQKPPGLTDASLESVACPTASVCFAVGGSPGAGPDTLAFSAPLIERFG